MRILIPIFKGKVKDMMEMFQQRGPDIEEIRPDDEILRVLLGANSQLAHTYRDLSSVYGGLDQIEFFPHADTEVEAVISKIREDVYNAGHLIKASINLLKEAFEYRLKTRKDTPTYEEEKKEDRRGYA